MNYILIPLVIVLAALTVITLVRGIVAFLANTKEDLERPEGGGPSASSAQPSTELASSTAPIASIRAACFGKREPSTNPVVPSSPVRV